MLTIVFLFVENAVDFSEEELDNVSRFYNSKFWDFWLL